MKPSLGLFLFTICFLFEKNLFKCEKDEISNYSPAPIDNRQFSKNNLYCDFQRKNCSWRASGLWQWDRGNSENLQLDGPLGRASFYIYTPLVANFNLNNKKTKGPQKEFLTSPELDAPKKNVVCLSFNYYTYLTAASNDGIKLFLLSVDEKNKTEIWSHGNSEIDDWLEAKVDVVTNAKYKLSFEAYGRKGFVGLERFRIDSGYCKNGMCDFESGMCRDWTVDSQPDGNNFVVTQAGRTTFTNPIDHTSHSGFGHFAYAKNPLIDPLHARLISPKMDHLDKQCFKFSFMRTNTDVQLVLFKKYSVNDSYSEIWRSNYTHLIDQWSTVQQTITIDTPTQLILNADFAGKPKKNTQIAVDDISMISYACDDLTSCNFVRTYCGWEANRTVGFEWSVGKGRVERADKLRKESLSSFTTLLYSDFTTLEDGETESMEIISPAIEAANPPDHGNCMSFDYKVLDIGKDDQFTLIQIDMLGKRKVLWNFADTKKSPSVNFIREELVFIPNPPNLGTSRLAFRLTSSNPYTRIAIDRIQMRSGSTFCSDLPGVSTIPTPSPTPSTVPTQNPFKALNCDFEENTLCTWKSSDPPNRYRVITGDSIPKHNRKYFPDRDHTTLSNKGHYAYMFNLKNSGNLVNATLTAPYPNVKASQVDLCIDFSYYFYTSGDENDASLTLDTSTTSTVVWRAPFGISNTWHRVRFTYVKPSQVYNSITFRTTLVQGMFAIDDVNITTGYCIRDEKLQQDVVSDFEDQKASNLEPTFYSGVQKWKIYKGSDVGIPDHTTHSLNGHYYGLAFSDIPEDSHKWNANSEVQTQFDQVGQNRCIRFSYYLGNLNPNTTTFGYDIETKSTQMSAHAEIFKGWEISGDTNKLWFSHHIPIEWSSYYRIRFFIKNIGEFTKDVRGSLVFIDDFTLSPSSCLAKGCNFEDGNTCSMEVMPVSKYKLPQAVSQRLSHQSNGSVMTNGYLNDYVNQIWQIFAPVQEDPTDHYYPARSISGRLSKSFLLMTADSDWQRAIITTESYIISKFKTGLKSQMCLSFYIHKPESSNSVLQIFQGDSLLKTSVLIFSMTRASHDRNARYNGWEKINILVEKNNNQNMDVSFYFVGTIGNGDPSSYIAIDEVYLTDSNINRQCDEIPSNVLPTDSPVTDSHGNTILQPTNSPSTTFTCKDGNVIPISKVCDNQDDCKGSEDEMNCGSCNFNNHDLCGYTKIRQTPKFEWDFNDKFPKARNNFEYGSYIEVRNPHDIDFTGGSLSATIESPIIRQTYSECRLSFTYRPNGTLSYGNTFKVYLLNLDSNVKTYIYEDNFQLLTSLDWTIISISIGRISSSFKIGFQAQIGSDNFESHSLKYLNMGLCKAPKPVKTNSECEDDGAWSCGNKVCIDEFQRCNFVDDCGDNTDEIGCDASKMIDFSSGFGAWTAKPLRTALTDGYRIESSKAFFSFVIGPRYDHTNGPNGSGGKMLFFRQTMPTKDKKKPITAEFESPPFRYDLNCKVSFFYFLNSVNATISAILEELDVPSQNRQTLNEFSGMKPTWKKGSPSMYRAKKGKIYKLILSSSLEQSTYMPSKGPRPYIAIDDISFTKECKILSNSEIPTLATLPGGVTQTMPPDDCAIFRCKDPKGNQICLTVDQLCNFVKDCSDGSDETNCGNCNFNDGTLCGWGISTTNGGKRYWKNQGANTSPGKAPKTDADNKEFGNYAAVYSPEITSLQTDSSPAIMISPVFHAKTRIECTFRFSYFSNYGSTLKFRKTNSFILKPMFSLYERTYGWKSYSFPINVQYSGFQMDVLGFSSTIYKFLLDVFVDNFQFINCDPNVSPVDPHGNTISPTATATTDSLTCDFENGPCGWSKVENIDHPTSSGWQELATKNIEPGNDHTSLQEPKPAKSGTWMGISNALNSNTIYLRSTFPLPTKQTYCFTFWYYFMSPNTFSELALYQSPLQSLPKYSDKKVELFSIKKPRERNWMKAIVSIEANDTEQYLYFVGDYTQNTVLGLDDIKMIKGPCVDEDIGENCNFESGNCGWKIDSDTWKISIGEIEDHTTNSKKGHYLTAVADPGSKSTIKLPVAKLPYFNDTNYIGRPICLRFFYLFQTKDSTVFENDTYVGARYIEKGDNKIRQRTAGQVQNEDQLQEWVMFSFNGYIHRDSILSIFAQREHSHSAVFVDDISIKSACEVGGYCDFETDFCGWTNVQSFQRQFIRFQPNTEWESGKFLRRDTTKRTNQGHYALFPNFDSTSSQELRSPILESFSNVICFRFNYFGQTKNNYSLLKVGFEDLTHPNKEHNKMIEIKGAEPLEWKSFEQQYTNIPRYFRLKIGLDYSGYLASDVGIDDIKVENWRCSIYPTSEPTIPPSEQVMDCNFEKNCNWQTNGFTIGSYSDQSDKYAPNSDHTTGNSNGKYAMVHMKTGVTTYTLESTKNISYDKDRCLTFWYYEDGDGGFEIRVYKIRNKSQSYLTTYSSQLESRKKWTLLKADILAYSYFVSSEDAFYIQIEYHVTGKQDFDFMKFAIDDIKVTPGACSHQYGYVYNFENGYDNLDVENIQPLKSYATSTFRQQFQHDQRYPAVDHTTGTDTGTYFIFRPIVYSHQPAVFFQNALSILNLKIDSFDSCVRFAYQLSANVTFKVFSLGEYEYNYDYAHNNISKIWEAKYPTQKDSWTIAEFNKHSYGKNKLVLYMNSVPSDKNFLAIDDIVILNQHCQPAIDCDFEQSRFCSYSPMIVNADDRFNFGIFTGPAQDSSWPGPMFDHSKGSFGGAYMYLTSYRSASSKKAHTAKTISGPRDVIRGNSYCLSLYTQLNQADLKLKLSLLRLGSDYSSSNQIIEIGSLSNVQQHSWTVWNIQLDDSNIGTARQIQLIIEGSLGMSSSGAIAIDDIQVLDGQCIGGGKGDGTLTCESGKVVNQTQICDFVKDCPSGLDEAVCGTCNFENGPCGWKNISSTTGFALVKASSVTNPQAPSHDADFKSDGHYMLAQPRIVFASLNSKKEIAVNFDQPTMYLKHAYATCVMVFDYYIKSLGRPNLEVKIGNNRADLSVFYRIQNSQTNGAWRKGYVHISNRYTPFFVDISAFTTSGAIAVDNINFVNCSLPAPKSTCASSEFRCKQFSYCINNDSVCDFIDDCADGSDELGCYKYPSRCNFESDASACKITDESGKDPIARWSTVSPRSSSLLSIYEPLIDNTLHTPFGKFFILRPLSGKTNTKGTFSTAMMSSKNGQTCKLRFFYFIGDAPETVTNNKLTVQIRYAQNSSPEQNIIKTFTVDVYGEVQQRWNKGVVSLDYTSPFQVIFTGYLGANTARIAVDDLTFDDNCQTSSQNPFVSTSSPSTIITSTTQNFVTNKVQTTDNPVTDAPNIVHNNKSRSHGHGGTIAASILIPLFVVAAAVGGFIWFKKRQKINSGDDTFSFSINRVTEDQM